MDGLAEVYGKRVVLGWCASVGLIAANPSKGIVEDVAKYVRDLVGLLGRAGVG